MPLLGSRSDPNFLREGSEVRYEFLHRLISNLGDPRLGVDATLSSWLPFEVLHDKVT